jgi:hypothetical protein
MKDLLIAANRDLKTPLVDFKLSGALQIEGESISSNPVAFYEPVIAWLNDYKKTKPSEVTLSMQLDYFNTSSSKIFYTIFKVLESFQKEGSSVKIIWFYEKMDEDMVQSGKDYSSIIKVPFEIEEIK